MSGGTSEGAATAAPSKPVEEMTKAELREELIASVGAAPSSSSHKAALQDLVRKVRGGASGVTAEPEPEPEPEAAPLVEAEEVDEAAVEDEAGKAIALREQAVEPTRAVPSVGELAALSQLATSVYRTTFVPQSYRGREPDVLAAFLFGREIGLGPMMSLRDIHMIDGRPALAAHRQLALLRQGGVTIVESTSNDKMARIKARRADTGEVMEVNFSYAEAELITQKGKPLTAKDNWRSYPADMLWARAVGRLTRRLGPDLAGGLPPYVAEEVADFSDWETSYDPEGQPTFRQPPPDRRVEKPDWNMPAGWAELNHRFSALVGSDEYVEWVRQALPALHPGTESLADLDQEDRKVMFQKLCGVLYLLDDDPDLDPMFDPEIRSKLRRAFAERFDGISLDGPAWALSPKEAESRPQKSEVMADEPEEVEGEIVDEAGSPYVEDDNIQFPDREEST